MIVNSDAPGNFELYMMQNVQPEQYEVFQAVAKARDAFDAALEDDDDQALHAAQNRLSEEMRKLFGTDRALGNQYRSMMIQYLDDAAQVNRSQAFIPRFRSGVRNVLDPAA